MKNIAKRISAALLTSVITAGLFAAPSFAWGQDGGAGGGGGGTGGGTNPPISNTPNPNGGGGGGGGGSVPSNLITKRFVPNTGLGAGLCAFQDDRTALGSDLIYRVEYAENTSGPENPPSGGNWQYLYATPNGTYFFQREVLVDFKCLYPSRTTTVVERCVIKTDVDVQQKAPVDAVLGRQTSFSGWSANSPDYQGCKVSQTRAGVDRPLPLGYFESTMVHTYQNIVVEIATTVNDLTGTYDAPKVVGYSSIYPSAPVFKTAHVACPDPTKIVEPGNRFADFSMTPCSDQYANNNAPLQKCLVNAPTVSAPVPVPFGAPQNGKFLEANPGYQHDLARDGKSVRLQFNQDITGANVKVNEYFTYFKRSGTPWDPEDPPSDNLFGLYAHPTASKSLFTMMTAQTSDPTDSNTSWMTGKVDVVYPASNAASDGPEGTKLTQVVKWKGTVDIETAVATFNLMTGEITASGTSLMTIPTEGACESSVNLSSKTTKGDSIKQ